MGAQSRDQIIMTKRLHLYDGPGRTRCGVWTAKNKAGDRNWTRFPDGVTCPECKRLMAMDSAEVEIRRELKRT